MLNASSIVPFLAITDADRAQRFYERTLGLTFLSDEPTALVFDANGVSLRLSKVAAIIPAPYTVLGWQVANIRAEQALLEAGGVTFERYEGLPQDSSGICTFPGGAQVAWFKDPDGNLLSLTQLRS